MKQAVLMMALLIALSAGAQTLGSNGSNVPENLNAETTKLIKDIWKDQTYILRVRQDKDKLTQENADKIIAFAQSVNLKVIFTFNTRGQGADDFVWFDYLRLNGVDIIAAEMGNEEYAQVAGHLSASYYYNTYCVPIINTLNEKSFTGYILFPIAPRPLELGDAHGGRRVQSSWNDFLATVINTNIRYQPVFHIYFNAREYPAIALYGEDKGLPKAADYSTFFADMVNAVTTNDLITATCTYASTKFPDKKMYITEFGAVVNSGGMSNAFGFEACRLWGLEQLTKFSNVECVLIHNGITSTTTGFINTTKRQDLDQSVAYQKRLGYYVLDLYLNKPKGAQLVINTADKQGKFINATKADQSAGYCSWWLQDRPASYELGTYSETSGALSFGYAFQQGTVTVCDTTEITETYYVDSTITITGVKVDYIPKQTSVIVPVREQLYLCGLDTIVLFSQRTEIINSIDTIYTPYQKDSVITIAKSYTYDSVYCYDISTPVDTIPIDTIPTPPAIQPLDADTLIFYKEVEFEQFLDYYGLADYEVLPAKFNPQDKFEDVVPFKYMTNKAGNRVWCPDPSYYKIFDANGNEIPENSAYLNEEGFAGKRYVAIFDHSGLAKSYREFYTEQCPEGDWRHVDIYITNPLNGQTVLFVDAFTQSDRNGEQIFNNNLKCWLLWGKDLPEKTYDFIHFMPDETSGCDFTFKEVNPEHDVTQLRFTGMQDKYGYLRK